MKINKKIIASCAAIATIISGLSFFAVSAEDIVLSENQLQQVKGYCLTTKNALTQLHSSDALLRVNRGQIYESMYTKLMDKFNIRATSNKLDGTQLKVVSIDYSSALDAFRKDYITYEEQFSKTLNIDCDKQPKQFYEAVAKTRTLRGVVHDDVLRLNDLIDQYQVALDAFSETNITAEEVKI